LSEIIAHRQISTDFELQTLIIDQTVLVVIVPQERLRFAVVTEKVET